uniref:Gustatory receptor n=1 Tax=Timema tahoe TaxID=61484 RepID=A0A7R9IGM4_9NEOP|nr:unnamed protein product [Timema tahoe]
MYNSSWGSPISSLVLLETLLTSPHLGRDIPRLLPSQDSHILVGTSPVSFHHRTPPSWSGHPPSPSNHRTPPSRGFPGLHTHPYFTFTDTPEFFFIECIWETSLVPPKFEARFIDHYTTGLDNVIGEAWNFLLRALTPETASNEFRWPHEFTILLVKVQFLFLVLSLRQHLSHINSRLRDGVTERSDVVECTEYHAGVVDAARLVNSSYSFINLTAVTSSFILVTTFIFLNIYVWDIFYEKSLMYLQAVQALFWFVHEIGQIWLLVHVCDSTMSEPSWLTKQHQSLGDILPVSGLGELGRQSISTCLEGYRLSPGVPGFCNHASSTSLMIHEKMRGTKDKSLQQEYRRKTEQRGEDNTEQHGEDNTEQHGEYNTYQHGEDNTEQHGEYNTEQHGEDNTKQHGEDNTEQHDTACGQTRGPLSPIIRPLDELTLRKEDSHRQRPPSESPV